MRHDATGVPPNLLSDYVTSSKHSPSRRAVIMQFSRRAEKVNAISQRMAPAGTPGLGSVSERHALNFAQDLFAMLRQV